MARTSRNLLLSCAVLSALSGRAFTQTKPTIAVTGAEVSGDSGTITVSINVSAYDAPVTETVTYGPYSTTASIAAAFGGMFTRDYNSTNGMKAEIGLTAKAGCSGTSNSLITFALASGTFGALGILGPTTSFNLNASGSPPTGFASVQQISYASGQLTMSTNMAGADFFYTLDGSPATIASQLYTAPITVSSSQTVNSEVVNVGSGGGVVQNMNNASWCSTAVGGSGCTPSTTNWETIVTDDSSLESYNVPYLKNGGGVSGIPSSLSFTQGLSSPSLDSLTLHMTMGTNSTANTQVLYTGSGSWPAVSANQIEEDFWILQGSSGTYKSYQDETDMELFDRDLQLDASLECDSSVGYWRYNGQGGTWQDFPTPAITKDCPYPYGTLSTAITSTSQCSFTLSAPVDVGSYITFYGLENIQVTAVSGGGSSGTQVTECIRGAALPGHGSTAPSTYASGTGWAEWVHVQWYADFNPGVTNSVLSGSYGQPTSCTTLSPPSLDTTPQSVPIGTPTECVFFGSLKINGTLFGSTLYGGTQWGQQTVYKSNGEAITVSNLYRPTEAGYSNGGPVQRCFNQFQLYSENVGTVDFYLDNDNVTCSYGVMARYTFVVP